MTDKFHDDDLSSLFGGAPKAQPQVNRAPVDFKPVLERFAEPCAKCRGTGRFGSYGQCFKCRGSGRLTFKTAPEKRAQGRAYAHKRAQEATQERVRYAMAFRDANPVLIQWLEETAKQVSQRGGTWTFPTQMLEAIARYGSLTDNQRAAIERLMARQEERKVKAAAIVENAPAVNLSALDAAFAKASEKLGRPRLRLAGMIISHAPATGKNPGALYVKGDQGQYLGKIVQGKFMRSRECSDELEQKVLEVAADPKGAAIAYGKLSGSCAICARRLDNSESIERGIGPICAEKFGW